MIERTRTPLVAHRGMLESARWHDNVLYVSDIYQHEILRIDPATGTTTVVAKMPEEPSGLGWFRDGSLMAVSVQDRKLLSVRADGSTSVFADLSTFTEFAVNDMVIDDHDHAFIGQTGFDRHAGPLQDVGSPLFRVDRDRSVHVAAEDLHVANGMVVTSDGETLIVAESLGHCLSAFDLSPSGELTNRRVWAQFESIPDGICLDAQGAVWVAFPHLSLFRRVSEGGAILEEISVEEKAVCCVLGGHDGRSLFMLITGTFDRDEAMQEPRACIEVAHVPVPG
jgi:sugar lactone lactonase YvrE